MAAWKLQEAEAACDTVFDRAFAGEPQVVMRNGEPSLVVITYAQYEASRPRARRRTRGRSFVDFLRSCPADLSQLDLARNTDCGTNREKAFA